jgi:ABC-type transport system involved in multi-copper enzyme maturation permease subunit
MSRLVRAEIRKLLSVRLTYGMLALALALTALFATLEGSRAGTPGGGVAAITTASGLRAVTTVTGFSMLVAAALGAISATGEFRQGTATTTYQATPERWRVLLAKASVAAGAGAVSGLLAGALATGIGLAFAAGEGGPLALGAATMAGHVAGAICGAAALAALGVGLGTLVRSQLAAVVGVFVWAIVIESLLGGLFTSLRPYLPYTAATTMAGVKLGGAAFGPAHDATGVAGPLPFLVALALLAALALAVSLLAARTTLRRDIA